LIPVAPLRVQLGFHDREAFVDFEKIVELSSTSIGPLAARFLSAEVLAGKETLFGYLKPAFPLSHSALMDACGRLVLLEYEVRSQSMANYGEIERLYTLALEGPRGFIGVHPMPASCRHGGVFIPTYQKIVDSLPTVLRHLYSVVDALDVPGSLGCDVIQYDLPSSLAKWEHFDYCAPGLGISQGTVAAAQNLAGGASDLRVWIRGTIGESVLVDVSRSGAPLIVVSDKRNKLPYLLRDPVAILDRYFANAILGFPGKSPF
jgi:hypothetical protein